MKPGTLSLLPLLLLGSTLSAQAPDDAPPDPIELVSRAEAIAKEDAEGACVLLLQAQSILFGRPEGPVRNGTLMAVNSLLKQHDPFDMRRRVAFTEVAELQTAIGKSYRSKKWYDTAQGRLDVAAQYDPDAASLQKERKLLASKRPTADDAPKQEQAAATDEPRDLLAPDNTLHSEGPWRHADGELRVDTYSNNQAPYYWLLRSGHEDNDISLEFCPEDQDGDWSFCLQVGSEEIEPDGIRAQVTHPPKSRQVYVEYYVIQDRHPTAVEGQWVPFRPEAGKFHELRIRVDGRMLHTQVDGSKKVTMKAAQDVRGLLMLLVCMKDMTLGPVTFRQLRIDPLPSDAPSDEELREQSQQRTQNAIGAAVEEAKALMEKRDLEPAAKRLREALLELDQLDAGVLRSSLEQTITATLQKADVLRKKRADAAERCSKVLGEMADAYLTDKRPRLARLLAWHAWRFDPDGQQERRKQIDDAIAAWNAEQLTKQAALLAPPDDDGAVLREWFAGGRLLDSRANAWIVDGPSARVEDISHNDQTIWMPKSGTLAEGECSVHVRLPKSRAVAGLCFDAAGPHDYAIAQITRLDSFAELLIARWAGGKWIHIARKRVNLDGWRLEAWMQITLKVNKAGVRMEALGASLDAPRAKLGLGNGRIGLVAGNGGDTPVTIELRAFQVKK